jgi:outer membrane lipoprotein SlyB
MKKLFALVLVCVTALAAPAQVFRPEVVNGAVLGGLAGAIIGNNSGNHNGAQGLLIGAVAGGLIGAVAADANRQQTWGNMQVPAPEAPRVVYRAPREPRPHYGYHKGDRVLHGALFGGLAGAIIGNNSGRHNGARGAVIGATAGMILGAIADDRAYDPAPRFRRHVRTYEPAAYVYAQPAPAETAAPAPQQVTIINNYYVTTPMSGANALFGR